MLHEPLVVLDFETTGLRPEGGDRITEVGLVRIEGGRISARYQSLVNCGVRVPRFISTYTGITQQMVDSAPAVGQVMREVAQFIGETPVVAHCASFDEAFYVRECQGLGLDESAVTEPFICSMRLARRIYPHLPSHSLGELIHALHLEHSGTPHRAAVDAEVTARLMLKLGRDLTRMHAGMGVTTQMLRDVIATPVTRQQPEQQRLCA